MRSFVSSFGNDLGVWCPERHGCWSSISVHFHYPQFTPGIVNFYHCKVSDYYGLSHVLTLVSLGIFKFLCSPPLLPNPTFRNFKGIRAMRVSLVGLYVQNKRRSSASL